MKSRKHQTGWALRLPGNFIRLLLLASLSHGAIAADKFQTYCESKGEFAQSTVEYRDREEDWHSGMNKLLSDLKKQYESSDQYPHHVYVDLQSVVRRAYRNHGNGFRVKDAKTFGMKIRLECLRQGF